MEEEVENEEVKRVKVTNFQSPVPTIIKIRNLIYGKRKPDIYTRITYYINLVIWITFLLWNVISYFTITSRNLIKSQKGISVEKIIEHRGAELGFEPGEFLTRLTTFHAISILCWTLVFFGLVLLYRKKKQFVYFTLIPVLFFIGMNIFFLSFTYFSEDTTMFDKITLLIFVVSCFMHAYLMNNERNGGSIGFFGENTEAEESP